MYLYGLLVLVATGLAAVAIWAPRSPAPKFAALVLTALLMAGGYGGLMEVLGRPKPMKVAWTAEKAEETTVLAARFIEGEAIYLWLESGEAPIPRAYVLPWSMENAKQLNEATRQAESEGTVVQMRKQSSAETETNEPIFYARPQAPLPDKTAQTRSDAPAQNSD